MEDVFQVARKFKLEINRGATAGDGRVVCFPPPKDKTPWETMLAFLPAGERAEMAAFAKRFEFEPKAGSVLCFDRSASQRVVLAVLPKPAEPFFLLELARKALEPLHEGKIRRLDIELGACGDLAPSVGEAFVSANMVLNFEPKHYGKASSPPKKLPALNLLSPTPFGREPFEEAIYTAAATNLVRYLSGLAGNDRTPSRYIEMARDLGKRQGLTTELFGLDRLKKMRAGAFLAVAQGSADKGAGILKLTYAPRLPKARVCLVGKGITFDTGGTQLKSGEHMYGMNGDMGGSAVALALVLLAAERRWPWEVQAYLAITENAIGPLAYRPNDVVRTLRGKTIEITDADAEGRLVLADTLWLASQSNPDVLMDFATLTGACVRAIGTSFSGAYTNRPQWYGPLIEVGRQTGERVWPFPADPDFGRCLKSDIADYKQCRITGGSDHIEAGYLLSRFVPKKTPWVHVDLSAADSEDGLAHVPTKLTGFGVRFGAGFLRRLLGDGGIIKPSHDQSLRRPQS